MEPLRFSNEAKLRKQMRARGWTEEQVREALATQPLPASGKQGPALRYQHPSPASPWWSTRQRARSSTWAGKGFAMTDEVYVYLLGEGTDVWRPAPAWKIGPHTYILLRPDAYDPDDEQWEFPPGSVVEAERRELSGRPTLTAVRAAEVNRQTA